MFPTNRLINIDRKGKLWAVYLTSSFVEFADNWHLAEMKNSGTGKVGGQKKLLLVHKLSIMQQRDVRCG